MDDRFAFLEAELLQHGIHALGPEDAHQVVFERQEELGTARVALAAGTATQLVVDAPALVAFGADDVEAAGLDRLLLEAGDFLADFAFLRRARLAFEACLFGALWSMQAAFPHMRARGRGRMINMCTLNGVNAHPYSADYNSSKEALRALSRTAARECGRGSARVRPLTSGTSCCEIMEPPVE